MCESHREQRRAEHPDEASDLRELDVRVDDAADEPHDGDDENDEPHPEAEGSGVEVTFHVNRSHEGAPLWQHPLGHANTALRRSTCEENDLARAPAASSDPLQRTGQ